MYTLKGVFPEAKKEHKKNFIKENMKQLKYIQNQGKDTKMPIRKDQNIPSLTKASPSNKNTKESLNVRKANTNLCKKPADVQIRKGDMAEFLKRKELRQKQLESDNLDNNEDVDDDEDDIRSNSSGQRDIGCQTLESNLAQKPNENTKLTVIYKNDEDIAKVKASGDSALRNQVTPHNTARADDADIFDSEKRSRISAILDKKDSKDPYLPAGYQKGVVPKYLRERKDSSQPGRDYEGARSDDAGECPPGHVTLPDPERRETLRMLRKSFGELVNELNKMPVKTDTLRMRSRKQELERQLAKLEDGIKVFSRPKVYVKIGE